MLFLNSGEDVQVRLEATNPGYNWKILLHGQTIDLPESVGRSYNFKKMEATKGNIGKVIVETKQIETPRTSSNFLKELNKIKGIGKYTAEDIVGIFKTKEELLKHIKADYSLPVRNDIEKKLREHYG